MTQKTNPDMKVSDPELDAGRQEAERIIAEAETGVRNPGGWQKWVIPVIAFAWSFFQFLLPKFILLETVYIRSIHLAFAIVLVYLSYPAFRKERFRGFWRFLNNRQRFNAFDILLAVAGAISALYIVIDYEGLANRQGSPITRDLVFGIVLIVLVLEAARRSLGPALAVLAALFIVYSFLGPYMPDVIAFKGTSLARFIGQETMSTEGLYGIPLDVSSTIVFMYVLFGAMMDKAGGGEYFVRLAFSVLGSFKGGPAKAAVVASGLTGLVSGSSVANVVTTGTFTIPLMKSAGYPATKAAAVEVAASTNGQLMPPIMGAAAFIIAEYCNVPYIEVVKAAFVPAVISYFALFYIVHLEAGKLGLKGIPRAQLPLFWPTLLSGIHFLLPLTMIVWELIVLRHSPELAAFNGLLVLMALLLVRDQILAYKQKKSFLQALKHSLYVIGDAFVAGGRNMMGIGVAVAAAGIIVGVVTMGLGGLITEVVTILAGGNLVLLLIITAAACLLLGMGLPTTANYIVMAALTAPVIVSLAPDMGLEVPLIAAHLFVFFFGILADDTPPVGLAAFAASAIAKSPPVPTGIQGFIYDARTAILPFMFIFNTRLLLIGVDSWLLAAWVFFTGVIAMFAFACATQGFFIVRNRWWETIVFLGIVFIIFRPFWVAEMTGIGNPEIIKTIGLAMFGGMYLLQRLRLKDGRPSPSPV